MLFNRRNVGGKNTNERDCNATVEKRKIKKIETRQKRKH